MVNRISGWPDRSQGGDGPLAAWWRGLGVMGLLERQVGAAGQLFDGVPQSLHFRHKEIDRISWTPRLLGPLPVKELAGRANLPLSNPMTPQPTPTTQQEAHRRPANRSGQTRNAD